MKLTVQKRLASAISNCSPKRIWIDPARLDDVKESITKQDIRSALNNGLIVKKQKTGSSRVRARKILVQKRKGRRKGQGSRKGTANARQNKKETWKAKIRVQRALLCALKKGEYIGNAVYRDLYGKVKGGFFRSARHIKLYIKERELVK